MKGKFVIVDGLDASGKSYVLEAFRKWAVEHGQKILDLADYCKEFHDLPEPDEVANYDVIISEEPTDSFVGRGIRKEMIKENNRKYSAESIAQAFALDREILYRRVIIPALQLGKFVFQERGVITSIVYQPVQEHIPLNEIMHLPGNRLALQNPPNLLIITKVEPEIVMERLNTRMQKDYSIFDNIFFQRKIAERYYSAWLKELFENTGAKVVYIDTNPPKTEKDVEEDTIKAFEDYLAGQQKLETK